MYEYTFSFTWSIEVVHPNYISDSHQSTIKQIRASSAWFIESISSIDEMNYSLDSPDIRILHLEHSLEAQPFTTVVVLQSTNLLDDEQKESILFQVRERLLSYTYCPFGPIRGRPKIQSEVISLDLRKAGLTLVK
jgi:hypothetical protein